MHSTLVERGYVRLCCKSKCAVGFGAGPGACRDAVGKPPGHAGGGGGVCSSTGKVKL